MPDSKKSTPDPHASPRQRLIQHGPESLSDPEVLEAILGTPSADTFFSEVGGLEGLNLADLQDRLVGSEAPESLAPLLAALELSTRLARARIPRQQEFWQKGVLVRYLKQRYDRPGQEILGVLYLDGQRRLIHEAEIFRGSLSQLVAEPRAIFRTAFLVKAFWIVLFHTHPSGSPLASGDDLAFTRRMVEAGEILGVGVLDHIILGDHGRWMSLERSLRPENSL